MAISEPSVIIRIAVSHHLHADHAIELESNRRKRRTVVRGGARVFGASLEGLQQCQCSFGVADGRVPRFLVDACSYLLEHVDTVGLFRKSGSVVRQRALRARLNRGEACLSTALPCDVACLLKQFCRELPEPLVPPSVHAALLKAQRLPSLQERTSATRLLSCLLPARNTCFLYYLLNFLSEVSHRCSENQMSSSNLAVVFAPCLLAPYLMAPCLLAPCDTAEGLGGSCHTAEGLGGSFLLEAEVVKTLIANAHMFGVVPESVMESVPVLLDLEEDHQAKRRSRDGRSPVPSALHRPWFPVRSRRTLPSPPSLGVKVSPPSLGMRGVPERTSLPSLGVRVSPSDPGVRAVPERRPSLRRSLGLETFPQVLVFRSYTLHAGQTSVLPSAFHTPGMGEKNTTRSGALKRAEAGKIGRFSVQLTRGGQGAGCSPALAGLAKLSRPWRR